MHPSELFLQRFLREQTLEYPNNEIEQHYTYRTATQADYILQYLNIISKILTPSF